ncbi:hypothetical protein BRARA_B02312 [Brassica rapa]|uniref:Transmembrane protein n=1 Tax=Brassica campestris TaxID=3711 RepID=A0A398ABS4_BRACM|nr:hypothetical protein BRARA_B02312 [Brassica rapa]
MDSPFDISTCRLGGLVLRMRSRLRSSEALCCKVVPMCVKTFSGIMVVIWMRSRLGTIDVLRSMDLMQRRCGLHSWWFLWVWYCSRLGSGHCWALFVFFGLCRRVVCWLNVFYVGFLYM